MQRPVASVVFGVLNVVFAVFGLCGIAVALPIMLMENSGNPIIELQNQDAGYRIWTYVSMALSLPLTFMMLAAGIGLLLMRSWGRTLSMWYAGISILLALVSIGLQSVYLLIPVMQGTIGSENPIEQAGLIGGAIGGVLGGFVSLIYCGLMMLFLSRPHVVAAFQGTWLPQGVAPGARPSLPAVPAGPPSSNPYISPAPTSDD